MKHAPGEFSFECIFTVPWNVEYKVERIASTVQLRVGMKSHPEKRDGRLEINVTKLSSQELREEENTGIKKSKAWLVEMVSMNSKQYPRKHWAFILHLSTIMHSKTNVN